MTITETFQHILDSTEDSLAKRGAQREQRVRVKMAQENQQALATLQSHLSASDKDKLKEKVLTQSKAALSAVRNFCAQANKSAADSFKGWTHTYNRTKLEFLVEPVHTLLKDHFHELIAGTPLKGYIWDVNNVAELGTDPTPFMNGHMRSSVYVAGLSHIAYAIDPHLTVYDHTTSAQVYRVPIHPAHKKVLEGTPYLRDEAVEIPGVYAWDGLGRNPFYADGKPDGQHDCCSWVQEAITSYTGHFPPPDFVIETIHLRRLALLKKHPEIALSADAPLVTYLDGVLEEVPIQKDMSSAQPGDWLASRTGDDIDKHPETGLGTAGHVSMIMGVLDGKPLVLEYARDREGSGMDGFGASIKAYDPLRDMLFRLRG